MAAPKEALTARNLFGRTIVRLGTGPIIAGVLLLVWEISVHSLEIWSSAIPAPSRVLLEIWSDGSHLGRHAWVTALEALEGLLLAVISAYFLAALAATSLRGRRMLSSIISLMASLPLIALAPLMIVWFGFGVPPAVAVCFLVCLHPLVSGVLAGFNSVPAELAEILRAGGAESSDLFRKVNLPASLPFVARALRRAIPRALAGATVTEFVGSDTGIGYLMFNAGSKANSTQLFAALAVLFLIALGTQHLVRLIERTWIAWPTDMPACQESGWQTGAKRLDRDPRI